MKVIGVRLVVALAVVLIAAAASAQVYPDTPSPQPQPSDSRHCFVGGVDGQSHEISCDLVPKSISRTSDWTRTAVEVTKCPRWKVIDGCPVSFLATRHAYDPHLRSNSEVLHSKTFILGTILMLASTSANLTHNWDSAHKHNQPHGGELLVDNLVPLGITWGGAFMLYKEVWAPTGLGIMGYAIIINAQSAATGVYH